MGSPSTCDPHPLPYPLFPGVGGSIQSDLWSMKQLVLYTGREGLFLTG